MRPDISLRILSDLLYENSRADSARQVDRDTSKNTA